MHLFPHFQIIMKLVNDHKNCIPFANATKCGPDLTGQLINDEIADVIVAIFQVAVTGFIAIGGIVTNVINIIVFLKMGLSDAVNISLFGLAIGDMCSLIFALWESISFTPLVQDSDAPVVFTEIEYTTDCWPHVCFVRVTSYITAFITLERCLCITYPLKVKSIITPTLARVVVVLIFALVFASSAPDYYVNRLVWKFYPEKNRTMLGIMYIKDREKLERISQVLNNVVLQCIAFISVVVCTVVLIVQLNRKAKWRQQTAKGEKATLGKDKKVIKMISFIAVIFLVSNFPSCMVFIAMTCTPQLHPSGVNYNMFYVIWAVVYVMEALNSTVNIFIYVKMSSKYKLIFYKMFPCCQEAGSKSQTSSSSADGNQEPVIFTNNSASTGEIGRSGTRNLATFLEESEDG